MSESSQSVHELAATAFARAVRNEFADEVERVLLYGSVARGDARGVDADVDLIVVLDDRVDRAECEARVRALAYDIELDLGVILSLVVLSAAEYEARTDRPFFQHVRREGQLLYG